MKIRQILEKDIPHDIYKKGFSISFPPGLGRDMFFVLDQDFKDLGDFIESKNKSLPHGILNLEVIDNKRYFRLIYNQKEITDEEAIKLVKSIFE